VYFFAVFQIVNVKYKESVKRRFISQNSKIHTKKALKIQHIFSAKIDQIFLKVSLDFFFKVSYNIIIILK